MCDPFFACVHTVAFIVLVKSSPGLKYTYIKKMLKSFVLKNERFIIFIILSYYNVTVLYCKGVADHTDISIVFYC